MAAPITILSPISSWVAEIVTQLSNAGINTSAQALIYANPFTVYLSLIPYMFYSFIVVASVIFVVRRRISFGVMASQERTALKTHNLFGGKKPLNAVIVHKSASDSIIDFVLPVLLLISTVIMGLFYTGSSPDRGLIEAFQHGDIFTALLVGGIISLVCGFICAWARSKLQLQDMPKLLQQGWSLMSSSIFMLCLAWTFSSLISNELGTGQYLAQLLVGSLPLFMLPVIFFLVSIITTVAIGSSWGAIAIIVAIAVPMVLTLTQAVTPTTLEHVCIMFPVLGAILSGAIAGNTISPIGDATIMASTSTQTYHEDHIKTQMAYNFPAILATGLSFITYSFLASYTSLFISALIALTIGIGTSCIILSYKHKKELINKEEKKLNAQ